MASIKFHFRLSFWPYFSRVNYKHTYTMKRIILMALIALFSLNIQAQDCKEKSLATVERVNGYYLFISCTPTMDYETLGEVAPMDWSLGTQGQFAEVKQRIIDRVKKKYKEADGIIFYFKTGEADRGEAIKFKQ